jgi:DNA recombination protein RmuC
VLVTARKLDALDESKVIATPPAIDEQPKRLSQPELSPAGGAEVARAEQAALTETGIGRPDLDFTLAEPPIAPVKKGKTA